MGVEDGPAHGPRTADKENTRIRLFETQPAPRATHDFHSRLELHAPRAQPPAYRCICSLSQASMHSTSVVSESRQSPAVRNYPDVGIHR
jgi:hypothetical protein